MIHAGMNGSKLCHPIPPPPPHPHPPKYQNKTKQNQKTPKKFKTDESLRRGPKKIQDN